MVKILISRRFKEGHHKEILTLLSDLRRSAVNQKGYVSGLTLVAHDDPQKRLVISTWQDMEAWQAWKNSRDRKNFDSMLELYQEKSTAYAEYKLG